MTRGAATRTAMGEYLRERDMLIWFRAARALGLHSLGEILRQ